MKNRNEEIRRDSVKEEGEPKEIENETNYRKGGKGEGGIERKGGNENGN